MMRWPAARVASVLGIRGPSEGVFGSISTDSRSLESGALFVALEGERYDGHRFLESARNAGASAAVVRRGTPSIDGLDLYEVEDTLVALGLLARERRRDIQGPVVALTGTNGKTSTKEMLYRAVATRWTVHATRENLNNLVGVPTTILEAPVGCEALVVEAGANLPGEIARLRDVIEPTLGLVTNVGAGHLEGFGSLEGVLQEKASLLKGVPAAVVGTQPPELSRRARGLADRVVTAGLTDDAHVRPVNWGLSPGGTGWFVYDGCRVDLPLLGRHQVENAILAVAVSLELDLDIAEVGVALESVRLPSGRCEAIASGEHMLLQDTYNANPDSLLALLDTAAAIRGGRRMVVVLGTMLELGPESEALHSRMADAVMASNPHVVAVMGEFIHAFRPYADHLGDRLVTAPDSDALGRAVAALLEGDEIILIKGSHGVHMERALPHIMSNQ
jgi:UDP-N-acetylmuramoyl-tripeptide--D-alanyl-D-alanine ligase